MKKWCKKGGPLPCEKCEKEKESNMKEFCAVCDEWHDASIKNCWLDKTKNTKEKETKVKKFWMVVCFEHTYQYPGSSLGTGPKARHHSLEAAQNEAEKLSKEVQGSKFIVLEATEMYEVKQPKPIHTILSTWRVV